MRGVTFIFSLVFCTVMACSEQGSVVSAADGALSVGAENSEKNESNDKSEDEVVALVAGKPVTMSALNEAAAGQLEEIEQKAFEIRYAVLNQMIDEQLLQAETAKRSIEINQLFVDEVEGKIVKPSPNEIRAFYEENAEQMNGSFEEMAPQLEGYLTQERQRERMMSFLGELRDAAGVKVLLSPRRKEVVAGESVRKGSKDAPIEIIEFSDFQCPYCAQGARVVDELFAAYGEKISVVFKHFPLSFHPEARLAAQAAECAGEQGKFWEYHDLLFVNQRNLKQPSLIGFAVELALDEAAFTQCLSSEKFASRVDADFEHGKQVGMSGTPGFYINGIPLSGAQPLQNFQQIIDAELARLESLR